MYCLVSLIHPLFQNVRSELQETGWSLIPDRPLVTQTNWLMPPSLSFPICNRPKDRTSSHGVWEEQRAGTWGPFTCEHQAAADALLKASP